MSEHVPYDEIPRFARDLVDELFSPEQAEKWWNAPNRILGNYTSGDYTADAIPREHPEAAAALLDAIADGAFF